MRNVRIKIEYDGTNYHGWQIQPNGRTVQAELTRVLSMLDQRYVIVSGAGRTDAGVHATGQVASFPLERQFEPDQLRDAINGNLDRDIRVLDVEFVDDSFNARFSARLKTYHYRVWTAAVVSPFAYRYVYHHRWPLDVEQMRQAAALLIGEHDFSAFTVLHSDMKDRVRHLEQLDVEGDETGIAITAASNGFLRYMVRTLVGTLIEVGRGRRSAASVADVLESRNRANAGWTAPAAGLTLMRVDY
jgi:tRNA pseudouridine38-40 synthase